MPVVTAVPPRPTTRTKRLMPRVASAARALLKRLGLRSESVAKKAAEQQKSALGLLTSRLASSLDDGTPRGRLASQQFRELAPLVSAVVGKHCHGHALRLQAARGWRKRIARRPPGTSPPPFMREREV